MPNPIVKLITQGARQRGIDPAAALAVAGQEGISGRIGDNGHAFGPFQLNNAGGVITGRFPGQTPQQIQQWASSPAGVAFALDRIAQVAKGQQGRQAIAAIVSRFERPADIPGETARAQASLPQFRGTIVPQQFGGAPAPSLAAPPSSSNPARDANALRLLSAGASLFGFDPAPLATLAAQTPAVAPGQTPLRPAGGPVTAGVVPRKSGSTIRFLEHFAEPFGLTVTSTTGGKHANGSYHYRKRAVDFGGQPAGLAALATQALDHPQDFREMFFTGPGNPGFFIKDGKVRPNSQLDPALAADHTDHVHLAA